MEDQLRTHILRELEMYKKADKVQEFPDDTKASDNKSEKKEDGDSYRTDHLSVPTQIYADAKEASWKREGSLVVVHDESFSMAELVVYKFGQQIIDELILWSPGKISTNIYLLAAVSLPSSDEYSGNAFRNSVHFDVRLCDSP